jgi:hypothetical protein
MISHGEILGRLRESGSVMDMVMQRESLILVILL